MFSVNFFTWKKNFFWVCLFPTILKTHKLPSKTPKFGGKSNFLPKSSKINKNWFFFKFLRQFFRVPPEVHWVWFLGSYDFFWQKYEILNKKNFWKKKTKSTFNFFFSNTVTIIFFSALLMQKPRLFNVYLFFWKQSACCFLTFFFQKFFLFKISYFCQKKSYDLKNHTQGTSGGTLKNCRRNLKKNQFLLIFDDFGKKFDFPPNLGVFEGNLWVFKMVGNRQTQKKIFFSSKKIHGEHVWYP